MRRTNETIVRECHPVPTSEETIQEIVEVKYFSKINHIMVYCQIELHSDSRKNLLLHYMDCIDIKGLCLE